MSEVLLEVKGISKRFRLNEGRKDSLKEALAGIFRPKQTSSSDFNALKNISFEVKRGDVLGIIGKNGAGKSTLLKILSGITPPDEGEVNFYGKAASILDVGAGFHPELTGKENVYLSTSLYGLSKKDTDECFQQIVDFSGISTFINEPVKNYSAGMYLRLAFSVVAHIDADILIFDEVLGVGDAAFQLTCQDHLQKLKFKGKAILLVTHNMKEAMQNCSSIIELDSGEIEKSGTPEETVMDYIRDSVVRSGALSEANFGSVTWNRSLGEMGNCHAVKTYIKSEAETLYLDKPFEIRTEINLLQPEDIGCVYHILDSLGTPVFTSFSKEEDVNCVPRRGKIEFVCSIPPNLLNKGLFRVNVFLTNKDNDIYHLGEAFYFEISLRDSGSKGNFFYKRYPGPMRPKLEWEIIDL